MSKQVIIYNEQSDSTRFADVSDDTFVLSEGADGSWKSMTYNEWEALRCRQACAQLKEQVAASGLDADAVAKVQGFLDSFTESMQVKYLEGKRSWVQIYTELAQDFEELAK